MLIDDGRQRLLTRVKESVSITHHHWETLYLKLLNNFAEYVQLLPASDSNHHSYPGGLLDHSMEVMLYSLRLRRNVLYPIGGKEDLICKKSDIFTYAVATASLLHDVGKIITDQIVAYRQGQCSHIWIPALSKLPCDCTYTYKHNPDSRHKLHQLAGLQLANRLLPIEGYKWLHSDQQIYLMWTQALASDHAAGVMLDLISKADAESVKKNLGSDLKVSRNQNIQQSQKANTVSLLVRKMVAIVRQDLQNGDLKVNSPGAIAWVTKDAVYLVSKRTAEYIQNKLFADPTFADQTPKNPIKIINLLAESNQLLLGDASAPIIHHHVVDEKSNKSPWQQTLTFIVIPRLTLDPNHLLNTFSGTITPVSPLEIKEEVSTAPDAASAHNRQSESNPLPVQAKDEDLAPTSNLLPLAQLDMEAEFNAWLSKMIKHNQIRYNQPHAPVHVLSRKVLLVTPSIFKQFVSDNTALIQRVVELQNLDEPKAIKRVQRSYINSSSKNLCKGWSGENMLTVKIEGERKKSKITVLVLKHGNDIFQDLPRDNQALSWINEPMI
nr:MobH family relaxase [Motilimonas pumila]